MLCPECRAEVDPATGVCANCGSPAGSSSAESEPPWRQQVREAVERRKEKHKARLAKREKEGRGLSILPEPSQPTPPAGADELVRRRREEIKTRVEEKLAKPRQQRRIPVPADAGDVAIGGGSLSSRPAETGTDLEEAELGPDASPDDPAPSLEGADAAALDLATPVERLLSGLIDCGVLFVILVILFYLTVRILGQPVGALPASALAAVASIGALVASGYFLFFWSLSGQTFGNLLTRSRVIDPSGRPLGFGRAVLRGVGLILSVAPLGAGFVGIWSDHERRSWHDRLASTKVVRA